MERRALEDAATEARNGYAEALRQLEQDASLRLQEVEADTILRLQQAREAAAQVRRASMLEVRRKRTVAQLAERLGNEQDRPFLGRLLAKWREEARETQRRLSRPDGTPW